MNRIIKRLASTGLAGIKVGTSAVSTVGGGEGLN